MSAHRKHRVTDDELQAMIQMRLLKHASWKEIARRRGYASKDSVRLAVIRAVKATGDENLLRTIRRWRAYPPRAHPNAGGYMRLRLPGHPLASSTGRVFEHRMVLYDAIGPGPHPCSQCSQVLDWPEIVVDHINRKRTDNRLGNLRVCCHSCNTRLAWQPGIDYPAWWDDPEGPDDIEWWETDGVEIRRRAA